MLWFTLFHISKMAPRDRMKLLIESRLILERSEHVIRIVASGWHHIIYIYINIYIYIYKGSGYAGTKTVLGLSPFHTLSEYPSSKFHFVREREGDTLCPGEEINYSISLANRQYRYFQSIHFHQVLRARVSELGQHWFTQWLVTSSVTSHCQNQYWRIVRRTLGKT